MKTDPLGRPTFRDWREKEKLGKDSVVVRGLRINLRTR